MPHRVRVLRVVALLCGARLDGVNVIFDVPIITVAYEEPILSPSFFPLPIPIPIPILRYSVFMISSSLAAAAAIGGAAPEGSQRLGI